MPLVLAFFGVLVGAGGGLTAPLAAPGPYRAVADTVAPFLGLPPPVGTATAPVPSATPSATPAPSTNAAPAASALSLEDRAAKGEEDARASLEGLAPAALTVEQALALARGDVAARHAELEALGKRLEAEPASADDPETLRKLLAFARDPLTTFAAQHLCARLARPSTTDLLFEVWTGVPHRNATTGLAERLVSSDAVRQHASPALAVALALRDVKDCEKARELVATAAEVGDRRAVRALLRLNEKRGCGEGGRDDCFPCLRAPDARKEVAVAAATAMRRPPPSF